MIYDFKIITVRPEPFVKLRRALSKGIFYECINNLLR